MIQVLLGAGAGPNGASEYAGTGTLLSAPVAKDDIELVETLLPCGVNSNSHHQDGFDPAWVSNALPLAVRRGNKDMVRLLLDAGAAVDASYLSIERGDGSEGVDALGTTALVRACRCGGFELAALLLQVGTNVRDLSHSGDGLRFKRRPNAAIRNSFEPYWTRERTSMTQPTLNSGGPHSKQHPLKATSILYDFFWKPAQTPTPLQRSHVESQHFKVLLFRVALE